MGELFAVVSGTGAGGGTVETSGVGVVTATGGRGGAFGLACAFVAVEEDPTHPMVTTMLFDEQLEKQIELLIVYTSTA